MKRPIQFNGKYLLSRIVGLTAGLIFLASCASDSDLKKAYVCKAVGSDEKTCYNGHFFSDPNPSQAKLIALRMCREHHGICYIQYCNHNFKTQE